MSNPRRIQQTSLAPTLATEQSEEIIAEVDEPPEEKMGQFCWSPPNLCTGYMRPPPKVQRRESMLTRQLHSETEHTDDNTDPRSSVRALSTQSTWSNPSMAELTSDDGHSVASPAVSPPLPPQLRNDTTLAERPLEPKVKIVGHDDISPPQSKETSAEQKVEANLGRKRCISFACRGKEESKPVVPPTSEPAAPAAEPAASPPRRKSMLTFACPSKVNAEGKAAEKVRNKRPVSPPPPARRSSLSTKHRGSDSTVTHASPKSIRKVPMKEAIVPPPTSAPVRKFSNESDDSGNEGVRFHEFGTSEEEPEDWTQESTCYSKRLTIDDTLKKENYIRKTCEEAEEEVLEEEEEEEEEDDLEEALAEADELDRDDGLFDDGDETDEGFHSDDEEGFASSDSDNDSDGSDFEWWRPGGLSTAATSVDQLDRLAIVNSQQPVPSSLGSVSSSQMSPHSSRSLLRKVTSNRRKTPAMSIDTGAEAAMPDSTDFVCGTLDEDKPLEQAFINRIRAKKAAKHNFRPQDIDPSFPTSDPEMEDEDEVANANSADEMVGGATMDETDTGRKSTRGRTSPTLRKVPSKVSTVSTRSPPSPTPATARHRSPAPVKQRVSVCRSPPPQPRRSVALARSPCPVRKLFGHSPQRAKSPAPAKHMTSPPNSPTNAAVGPSFANSSVRLAGRPQLTHTASLPRGGGPTLGRQLTTIASDEEDPSESDPIEVPKRGAIDIVKGLEKKRQWRKKKLAQKLCAKNATKGEKAYKVKPGIGAERMREVGLGLQEYQGKAEHILSL